MSFSDISTSKINDSINPFTKEKNVEKKSLDDIDINRNYEFNKNDEDVIDKLEKKIFKADISDNFTRENQISCSVHDVIDVPKKKIKDEELILSDDKIKNKIKKRIMEKEIEEDNEIRKKEKIIEENKIKKVIKVAQIEKNKIKKSTIKLFLKYILFLFLVTGVIIAFIIYIL